MSDVFISYSRKDSDAVPAIVAALRRAGLSVWHDEVIVASEVFERQFRREVEMALCVIVIWSKAAATSEWVQLELRTAISAWSRDRLLLATLDNTPLPVGLRDLRVISITAGSSSGIAELVEHAAAIIAGPSVRAAPPAAPPSYGDYYAYPLHIRTRIFFRRSLISLQTLIGLAIVGILTPLVLEYFLGNAGRL